jgi:hypothetical protein
LRVPEVATQIQLLMLQAQVPELPQAATVVMASQPQATELEQAPALVLVQEPAQVLAALAVTMRQPTP